MESSLSLFNSALKMAFHRSVVWCNVEFRVLTFCFRILSWATEGEMLASRMSLLVREGLLVHLVFPLSVSPCRFILFLFNISSSLPGICLTPSTIIYSSFNTYFSSVVIFYVIYVTMIWKLLIMLISNVLEELSCLWRSTNTSTKEVSLHCNWP